MRNEEKVTRQLSREPRPELSPFFAARVTNELKSRERETRQRTPLVMRLYWFAFLVGVTFAVHSMAVRFDLSAVSLVLVPTGFGLWIYREEAAAVLLKISNALFGEG